MRVNSYYVDAHTTFILESYVFPLENAIFFENTTQLTFGSLPLHLTLIVMCIPSTNTNASYSDNMPHYNHVLIIASNLTKNLKT